ncbi:MAG: hypothetical protein P1P90_04585 [Patescibacteria group bacterium]|nr:hypothetical protein [Patescibacteria group bacterium]
MSYTHLKICEEITEDDFRSAIVSKEQTEAFLRHIEAISKPGTSVGKILFFFARLALRNKELAGSTNYVYEALALQVAPSRHNPTLFEIRYMNDIGGTFEQIFKVVVWCIFDELLEAVRDSKNISPFTCEDGRENFLLLKATADQIKTSIPPKAYTDADARYQELLDAGMIQPVTMLSPSRVIPTIPAPEDDDPAELLAGAVVRADEKPLSDRLMEARRMGKPLTSITCNVAPIPHEKIEAPDELSHATVGGILPPPRKKYDSLADEAMALAQQPPSIPSEPICSEDSVRIRQSEAIARLSLIKAPADRANRPVSKHKPNQSPHLQNRPETVRPAGIEETEDEDVDVDEGWGDVILPIVHGKREKNE